MDAIAEAPRSCFYCGEHADTNDHIIPDCQGGIGNDTNYVDACYDCNNGRGNLDIAEFMAVKGKTGPVPVGMTTRQYFDLYKPPGCYIVVVDCLHCGTSAERIFSGGDDVPRFCSRTHKKKFQAKRSKRRKRAQYQFTTRLTQTIGA